MRIHVHVADDEPADKLSRQQTLLFLCDLSANSRVTQSANRREDMTQHNSRVT